MHKLRLYDPARGTKLGSWIGMIAVNAAYDFLRGVARRPFLDQLDGMRKQLDALSNLGLLARFVGMLTDSRSFLSYSRHDYFRRLLCNLLGNDVQAGRLPDDTALLGRVVEDVCFKNARGYFGFDV